LGVLRKSGGPSVEAPLLRFLFSGDEVTEARLRAFYVHASEHVDLVRRKTMIEELKARVSAQREAATKKV
jgi:hypothetical protein